MKDKLTRRGFLRGLGLTVSLVAVPRESMAAERKRPPNIVWIVAEDASPRRWRCAGWDKGISIYRQSLSKSATAISLSVCMQFVPWNYRAWIAHPFAKQWKQQRRAPMNSPAVSRTDCRQDLARNLIQHPEERYFMLYTFNDAAILDVIETLAYYERLQNQKDALSAGGRHLSARVNVRAYREIG